MNIRINIYDLVPLGTQVFIRGMDLNGNPRTLNSVLISPLTYLNKTNKYPITPNADITLPTDQICLYIPYDAFSPYVKLSSKHINWIKLSPDCKFIVIESYQYL